MSIKTRCEEAPFLKATRVVDQKACDEFGNGAKDPWPEMSTEQVLDELRGSTEFLEGQAKGENFD